ncbi:MAG: PadR family transcriptional regulator [Candidatus Acidiferrales bacterium]
MKHNRFEDRSDVPDTRSDESRHFRFGHRCGSHHFRVRESEFGERFRRSGRHFGGWAGRGFGDRIFDSGELRYVILQLIAEKPRHGYELMKAIEDRLNGAYSPSPGLIYPTLTLLEEMGYATVSASEGSKKLYTITSEGRAKLEENKAAVNAVFERMDKAGAEFGRGRAPQIMRAIENFRYALRLKTSQSALTPEQVQKIADAIDAAAKLIEQS